jgi:hypothetical protein
LVPLVEISHGHGIRKRASTRDRLTEVLRQVRKGR